MNDTHLLPFLHPQSLLNTLKSIDFAPKMAFLCFIITQKPTKSRGYPVTLRNNLVTLILIAVTCYKSHFDKAISIEQAVQTHGIRGDKRV